jgi:hypothetical protein
MYIGIVAACIPCLKSLMEKAFRALNAQISTVLSKRQSTAGATSRVSSLGNSQGYHMHSKRVWKRISDLRNKSIRASGDEEMILGQNKVLAGEKDLEAMGIVKKVEISWLEDCAPAVPARAYGPDFENSPGPISP